MTHPEALLGLRMAMAVLSLLFLCVSLAAAAPRDFPSHLWEGTKESVVRPSALLLPAAGGAVLLLKGSDPDVREEVQKADLLSRADEVGDALGHPAVLYGGSAALWAGGLFLRNPGIAETGEALLESLAAAGIATAALKTTVHRERPDGSDSLSFPSLHASGSFCASAVLADRHGWKAGLPAYGWALFVSYSRMERDKHFMTDTLFGAALGTVLGLGFSRLHAAGRDSGRLGLRPLPGGWGLAWEIPLRAGT